MHTHSSEHTHTVNTHPEQWAANAAAPGEQLEVQCLAQGSHLSRGIEGGESAGYSLPPPTIPAGPETRTHNLRVTSPTRYPLGLDCPVTLYGLWVLKWQCFKCFKMTMLNKYGGCFLGRNTANWCIIIIKGERNGDQCLKNVFSFSDTLMNLNHKFLWLNIFYLK